MPFESYRGINKFINSIFVHREFVSMVYFLDILMVLKISRLRVMKESTEKIFFSFLKIKSLDMLV